MFFFFEILFLNYLLNQFLLNFRIFIFPLQRSSVLGNKIEMEITELVEKNTSLLRLGLHLEFNDARHRIANHLQKNIDRSEYYFCFASFNSNFHFTFFLIIYFFEIILDYNIF